MLPDRCTVTEEGKRCVNPPEFIVSIVDGADEYMVGVTCAKHKEIISGKIKILQNEGKIHEGKVSFAPVRAVGTDCIHGNEDEEEKDLVQIGMKNPKF